MTAAIIRHHQARIVLLRQCRLVLAFAISHHIPRDRAASLWIASGAAATYRHQLGS